MGVMPLPYTKRYEGLATGIYNAFESAELPFSMAFMRGASRRLEGLLDGKYNFIVVSSLTAHEFMNEHESLAVIHRFSHETYVDEHVLITGSNHKTIEDGMKVAMDESSRDHVRLTKAICVNKSVEFVNMPYNQILNRLELKEIDAAVWNGDELKEMDLKLNIHSINDPIVKDMNRAVILSTKDSGIGGILSRCLCFTDIEKTQKAVMENLIMPTY